ncbi:MAG: lamin tail domain-containing protein [candidate division KSB1 bacterium]|nr:lamin tail domain-containing protein [candidate division KSB1 bacterium]
MKQITAAILLAAVAINAQDELVINEIMYNSPGDDVEFVEIVNVSGKTINLDGWTLLDDDDAHTPCRLTGTLAPNAYLVIVGDKNKFSAVYPDVKNINANAFDPNGTGWSLGNNGDTVRLFKNGVLHDIVAYSDGGDWPARPDGNGPSLELLNPAFDNSLPENWDPSKVDRGTPGKVNSVFTTNVKPVCKDGSRDIPLPKSGDAVKVTVKAYDREGLAKVELMVNTGSGYKPIPMVDNGTNGDAVAGDSLFTAVIPPQPNGALVKYYAVAQDNAGQIDLWPNNAPSDYHAYTVGYTPPDLRITEVMAVNSKTIADERGEYDDWFEIYNAGNTSVNLAGMFVSDRLNSPRTFRLPNLNLPPKTYVLLWADNSPDQGALHTNFQLSSEGESIAIFETIDHGNVLIHGWKFGRMSADVSMGFKTLNATAPDYLKTPTPRADNSTSDYFSPVCINEFQTTSAFGGPDDWIEIYNRSDKPFDLSGCFLSDERLNNTKWQFPKDTILQPKQFLVIWEDALKFNLATGGGDVIMFTAADSVTGLDFYDFGPQDPDYSEGRFPDGGSTWRRFKPSTRGVSNTISSVEASPVDALPQQIELRQNYPNPFNPTTEIVYTLPSAGETTLEIYNMQGQKVCTLVSGIQTAGMHRVIWNGENTQGSHVAAGVYFYLLKFNDQQLPAKKMILVK